MEVISAGVTAGLMRGAKVPGTTPGQVNTSEVRVR